MPDIRDDWFEAERLHRAAADGDVSQMVSLVRSGFKVNEFDDLSRTPLHYAVDGEHYLAAQWLLDNGADVNVHDEEMIGETALCFAVKGNYPEMVELLLQRGGNPDITGWMQLTARDRAQRRKDDEGRKIAEILERYRPSRPNPSGRK